MSQNYLKQDIVICDQLRNTQQFTHVHPDTETLLFHMRFLISSDTFTRVCLFIFIV